MSTLYEIQRKKITETTITLKVKVVHPDSMHIPASEAFALMLLHDTIDPSCPLGQEIDLETVMNNEWICKYAKGFIKNVEVELENEPSEEILNDDSHEHWENRDNWLIGIMKIEVTHPAWLQHLQKGIRSWDSASFDSSYGMPYEDCESISPADEEQNNNDDINENEGMMPLWKYIVPEYLLQSEQDVLWVQKYGESAYKKAENQDFDKEDLSALEGKLGQAGSNFGSIHKKDGEWYLFSFGGSSCGDSSFNAEDLSLMEFNHSKKRLPEPYDVQGALWLSQPVAIESKTENDTITFKLLAIDEDCNIKLQDNNYTLNFLMSPFDDGWSDTFDEDYKISEALNKELETHEIDSIWDLYQEHPEIADKFIVKTEISQTKQVNNPNLRGKSNEELLALYDFDKWNQWEIKIQVSDASLLEKYEEKVPFAYGFHEL